MVARSRPERHPGVGVNAMTDGTLVGLTPNHVENLVLGAHGPLLRQLEALGVGKDEAIQEVHLALLARTPWDPTRGSPRTAFAVMVARCSLLNLLRKERRRAALPWTDSLGNDSDPASDEGVAGDVTDSEAYRVGLLELEALMPSDEHRVVLRELARRASVGEGLELQRSRPKAGCGPARLDHPRRHRFREEHADPGLHRGHPRPAPGCRRQPGPERG